MKKIVLASQSPRRKELLSSLKVPFETMVSEVDESSFTDEDPKILVEKLSEAKAKAVLCSIKEPSIVIGSDTVVVFDRKIIGKPKDEKQAFELLSMLSGQKHEVYTGLALIDTEANRHYMTYEKTDVYMRNFTDDEILAYIDTKEPMDKAGAYGIQGLGSILVERIDGDYYSVMGFPILKFYEGLKLMGYNLLLNRI